MFLTEIIHISITNRQCFDVSQAVRARLLERFVPNAFSALIRIRHRYVGIVKRIQRLTCQARQIQSSAEETTKTTGKTTSTVTISLFYLWRGAEAHFSNGFDELMRGLGYGERLWASCSVLPVSYSTTEGP